MSQELRRSGALTRRAFVERAAAGAAAAGLGLRFPSAASAATPARDPAIIGSWGGLRIPATGAYFGADDTTRGFTTAKGIETELGRRMGFRNRRYGWLVKCPGAAASADSKLGAPGVVPMTSFGSPSTFPVKSAGWSGHGDLGTTSYGQGIDRITGGEFDSYWRSVALGLKALGVPVIFRLWQEPNGPHNPYYGAWQGGVGTGGESAFVAAWRHIWTVFNVEKATLRAGGNCIWVFCAQQTTGPANTGGPWQPYWPGSDVVDWSGMDLYRETFPFEAVNPPVYGSFYQWAVDNHKPFMICESGFQQGKIVTDSSGRYDKDGSVTGHSLITATCAAVKHYPQCVAYGIWNNGRGNLADFVDTSAASLAQYRAFAHDPWFALTRS
jgi:hypothetical protein